MKSIRKTNKYEQNETLDQLYTIDMDDPTNLIKRFPRYSFIMDDHPIRSLELKVDIGHASNLHRLVHLIGQLDASITSNDITATVLGQNWVHTLDAQLHLALHDGKGIHSIFLNI